MGKLLCNTGHSRRTGGTGRLENGLSVSAGQPKEPASAAGLIINLIILK